MAKQRKTQLYRNGIISSFTTYSEAYSIVKSTLESQKSNLEDGEVILGRYLVRDNEQNLIPGILVGVARKSGSTVTLDILPDSHYVENAVGNANAYTEGKINALALGTTQLSSVSSSSNSSSFKVYSVKQVEGQVAVSTSDYQELVMDGQYDADSNKVALQSTVDAKIAALDSSAAIADLSNGHLTLTNTVAETDGLIAQNGTTSIWFASNPTQGNKVVTQAELTGIVGAMVYKGTVSSNTGLPTSGVQPGWTYVVDTIGTYAGQQCEVGDMIIAKDTTPTWNIVSGENQYELGEATIETNNGSSTTIGTFEGHALKLKVRDTYSGLSGTSDAKNQAEAAYIETPTSDFKVLRSVTQTAGKVSVGTVCQLKKVAATGAASDVSVVTGTNFTGTNVQTVLEELKGSISGSNTTINSLHGDFRVDTNTMKTVDASNRVISVKFDTAYLGTTSNGLAVKNVDTNGTSTTDSNLATVKTVNNHINALDGTVNANLVTNSLTPTGTVAVLTAVQETNGVLTTGTKVTLATVAHSGSASDISVNGTMIPTTGTNAQSAITEIARLLAGQFDNTINGHDGISVTYTTAQNSGTRTWSVGADLAANAHAIGSTAYNTNASNLLLIGSDGKLTIEDTWDCGTY